jgi:epoxyqueuosine reductase
VESPGAGHRGHGVCASRGSAGPPLERLASITEEEFQEMFHGSPVERARYAGFLRNVAVAMGNSGKPKFRPALEKLAASDDELVREHVRWALQKIAAAVW